MQYQYFFSKSDLIDIEQFINKESINDKISEKHINQTFTKNDEIEIEFQRNNLIRIWNNINTLINNEIQKLPALTVLLLSSQDDQYFSKVDMYLCLNFIYYYNKTGDKIYLNQINEDNPICQNFCEYAFFNIGLLFQKSKLVFGLTDDLRMKLNYMIRNDKSLEQIKNFTNNNLENCHPFVKLINELDLRNKKYINFYNIQKYTCELFTMDNLKYELDLDFHMETKIEIENGINYENIDQELELSSIINIIKNIQEKLDKSVNESINIINKLYDILIKNYLYIEFHKSITQRS